jgi:hypothetical protein
MRHRRNAPVPGHPEPGAESRRSAVNEVASLFQAALAVALLVVAPVVLVRWLGGPGRGWGLADLIRFRSETPWPRGVQEEEPIRWKVELLEGSAKASEVPGCDPVCRPAPQPHNSRRLRPITTG